MILSNKSPVIHAAPERLFALFENMETVYLRWHPDHIRFQWLDAAAVRPGVRFCFEERLGGKRMKKSVAFTEVARNRLIAFAPTSFLFRLFLPRMSFLIEPSPQGFTVTQEIHLRIGPLAAWLNRRELDAVRQHMLEEGENLKGLIEEDGASPYPAGAVSGGLPG